MSHKADYYIDNEQTWKRQCQQKQKWMASEKSMTQAIMQAVIKAAKTAIIAVGEAETPANTTRQVTTMTMWETIGSVLKLPISNWKSLEKDTKMSNFEVKHTFLTNSYNIQKSVKVPIIMSWLGSESLR